MQKIVHKSREISYQFNFTSDSVDSWSFVSEGDGEIYEIVATNIDESNILVGATALNLPKEISNGIQYSVTISRLIEGVEASIEIKCRRKVNKTKNFNLTSLFKYDGRYAYCLEEFNGVVHKLDTELLKASNYQGAGVWTVSPIIATINLPPLPADHYWSAIGFIKNNDVPKIICVGGKVERIDYHACVIHVDTGEVWDLLEENQNTYSSYYYHGSWNYYGYLRYFLYDYINEKVFFRTIAGAAGYSQFEYNLLTHEKVNNGYGLPFSLYNNAYNVARLYFDPVRECFCEERTDVTEDHRLLNFKGNTNACNHVYDLETGYTVGPRFYSSGINAFDAGGKLTVAVYPSSANLGIKTGGCGSVLLRHNGERYYCGIPFSYDRTSFIYVKLYDKDFAWQDRVNDLADAQSDFNQGSLCVSNSSALCLLLGISQSGLGKRRLHVLEPGLDAGNSITQRYFDFSNDMIMMVTNQLLV